MSVQVPLQPLSSLGRVEVPSVTTYSVPATTYPGGITGLSVTQPVQTLPTCPPNLPNGCVPAAPASAAAAKPGCEDTSSGYGVGAAILAFIIIFIVVFIIIYALRPKWALTPAGVLNTANVFWAALGISLLIVLIIWLIKAASGKK